ncbi:hypothetical protein GLYMA_04G150750v4 [Glycine max]|nr:hypothetical protein GLYMA_04G150750v4 [Glycine max]KAH1111447.1 hypothetical protein GYH30_010008 [Glycine max]
MPQGGCQKMFLICILIKDLLWKLLSQHSAL